MIHNYDIILASNSPRRKELLAGLGLNFKVKVLLDVDESYPETLDKKQVAEYIAKKKAIPYLPSLTDSSLLITADTIVLMDDKIYGKPANEDEAKQMLHRLSGKTHQVITGVCLTTTEKQKSFSVFSDVRFAELEDNEIDFYVSNYKPMDKAGAYGIQEWIGYVAVEYISGSYFNIMGLPIQRLYQEMKKF